MITITKGDLVEGSLFAVDQRLVRYRPAEVSRLQLVVLTDEALAGGARLNLRVNSKNFELVLAEPSTVDSDSGLYQARLNFLDAKVNAEAVLVDIEELKLVSRAIPVRSSRQALQTSLQVAARTFGSVAYYMLIVVDLSKSGLRLSADPKEMPPFGPNTVLELVIDPNAKVMAKALNCMGKVVRREAKDATVEFGLKFIDNDDRFHHQWSLWVDQVEEKSVPMRTPQKASGAA
jgi:hypothetical protein